MDKDHVDVIIEQWNKERPDLDPSCMAVLGRLKRLDKVVTAKLEKLFSEFGLNFGEFDVLATLLRSGEPYTLTPNQLLKTVMLTSGAMTNRLDKLEGKNFIQRQPDPNDRRGVYISLTPYSLEIINQAVTKHVSNGDKILSSLSSQEQETLALLLKKLLAAE